MKNGREERGRKDDQKLGNSSGVDGNNQQEMVSQQNGEGMPASQNCISGFRETMDNEREETGTDDDGAAPPRYTPPTSNRDNTKCEQPVETLSFLMHLGVVSAEDLQMSDDDCTNTNTKKEGSADDYVTTTKPKQPKQVAEMGSNGGAPENSSLVKKCYLDNSQKEVEGAHPVERTSLMRGPRIGRHDPKARPGAYAFGRDSVVGQENQEAAGDPQSQMEEGRDLVVAAPVDDAAPVLTEAVEWHGQENDSDARGEHRRKQRILLAYAAGAFCLILAIVISTVALVSTRPVDKQNEGQQSQMETQSPTLSMDDYLKSLLPEYSIKELEVPESSQSMAYDWIVKDPSLSTYPAWRIQQRFALATLFYSTDGPRWRKAESWLTLERHECEWHRQLIPWKLVSRVVESPLLEPYWERDICNEQGVYLHIHLYNYDLRGMLPPEITLLSSLVSIMVNNNALTGTLSDELGKMKHLEVIGLSGNDITGTLPSQVGLLSSLVVLGLFHNQLEGALPSEMGLLESVQGINIGLNAFTGTLPTELARLNTVVRMKFDNNQLTGTIPKELCLLTALETLTLDGNELTGTIPPEFGKSANLNRLDLGHNRLGGAIPTQLGVMSTLSYFGVSGNPMLSGRIPTNFCGQGEILFNCTKSLCGCECPCENN